MRDEQEAIGLQGLLIAKHAVLWNAEAVDCRAKRAQTANHDSPLNHGKDPCRELAEHHDWTYQWDGHENATEEQAPQPAPDHTIRAPEPHPISGVVKADHVFLGVIALADNAEMLDVEPGISETADSSFGGVVAGKHRDDRIVPVHEEFFSGCLARPEGSTRVSWMSSGCLMNSHQQDIEVECSPPAQIAS
jgi:hypothetical protein